jgi:hypothetical protein
MPTPSLLIVPARFKTGKLYSQIPTSGAGDFTVTRNTEARRFNSAGLIESVASGIPRLDYLTSGGTAGCPALLVEPAATNGILNSTDTTTSWTLGANLTSGAIDVIGVSGNNLTVAVSGSGIGSAAGRFVRFNNNVALASGSTYTVSFLMKKTGAHTIGGYQLTMSSGVVGSGFDVSGSFASGSNVDTAPTTNRIRRIERFGTDVFRCSETFTMTAAATGTHLAFGTVSAVSVSTNSAVGTTMGFAAPQLELGSVPTSFIPTTAGTGSRSADVISVSGAVSGSIGQTEGTIYAEVDIRSFNNVGFFATISDGTASNLLGIYKFTDGKIYFDRISATQSATTTAGSSATYTAPTILKIAIGYKSGETRMYINGVAATAQQTATFTFGTLTKVNIGSSRSDGTILNDRIRAVALYTTRLTDAELALITQP